jgi:hypothetical protein
VEEFGIRNVWGDGVLDLARPDCLTNQRPCQAEAIHSLKSILEISNCYKKDDVLGYGNCKFWVGFGG